MGNKNTKSAQQQPTVSLYFSSGKDKCNLKHFTVIALCIHFIQGISSLKELLGTNLQHYSIMHLLIVDTAFKPLNVLYALYLSMSPAGR